MKILASSPINAIRVWPWASRCSTALRAPPMLSSITTSASMLPGGLSMKTTRVPVRSSASMYSWSSPAGTISSPSTRCSQKRRTRCRSRSPSSSELAVIASIPRPRATSSTPPAIAEQNGFDISSKTSPKRPERRPCRRARTRSLRRKPSRAIASCTTSAVSRRTPGSSLTTRETVFTLTPASAATSLIVGRDVEGALSTARPQAATSSAPVIIPTTASRLVSLLSSVTIVRPSRRTVIRSATAKTSGRL